MKTLSALLAGVCAVLFVLTAVGALFLFNVEHGAFSPEPYKRAFEKQGLYDRMPAILASTLFSGPASVNGVENPIWALMSSDGVASGIASLVPPAELKAMTDGALDSIFAYINGDADSAAIPLTSFKNHLAGPAGTEAILGLLETQPACSAEQLFQMTIGALTGGQFFLCNPPPEAVELFRPLIQSQMQFTASILPNDIIVIPATLSGTESDPRRRLDSLRAWMRISPVFPVLFLLGIVVFAVRNGITFLNWWGYPLLITGGITFLLALLGSSLVGLIIQVLIETQAEQITSSVLLETLRDTTNAVAREILNPILFQGIAVGGSGFLMALAGFLVRRRAQPSQP